MYFFIANRFTTYTFQLLIHYLYSGYSPIETSNLKYEFRISKQTKFSSESLLVNASFIRNECHQFYIKNV